MDSDIKERFDNPENNSLLDLHNLMSLPEVFDIKKPNSQHRNCPRETAIKQQNSYPPIEPKPMNSQGRDHETTYEENPYYDKKQLGQVWIRGSLDQLPGDHQQQPQ